MGIPEPDVTVKPGDVEKGAKIFKTKCVARRAPRRSRPPLQRRAGGAVC